MARNKTGRTVLLTRFSALGDVAMTVPAVYDACRANPGVRFVFVTRARMAPVMALRPANLEVEPVDLDRWKGAAGMWRLMRHLRRKWQPDTLVDLHDVLRTRLLRLFARAAGMKVAKIDKGRKEKRRLVRLGAARSRQLTPTVERYAAALRRARLRGGSLSFGSIFGASKGDPLLFASVSAPKKPQETWIAVAPFAAHAGKELPLDMLREVTEGLAAREGYRIFVMGFGEKESGIIDLLAGTRTDKIINMARAKAGIGAELSLMSHCDVMLAGDSANMHLASLAGLPAVGVWGATHPFAGFLGYGQSEADVVQADMPCRPCSVYGNRRCRIAPDAAVPPCMAAIKASDVLARIDGVLKKREKAAL